MQSRAEGLALEALRHRFSLGTRLNTVSPRVCPSVLESRVGSDTPNYTAGATTDSTMDTASHKHHPTHCTPRCIATCPALGFFSPLEDGPITCKRLHPHISTHKEHRYLNTSDAFGLQLDLHSNLPGPRWRTTHILALGYTLHSSGADAHHTPTPRHVTLFLVRTPPPRDTVHTDLQRMDKSILEETGREKAKRERQRKRIAWGRFATFSFTRLKRRRLVRIGAWNTRQLGATQGRHDPHLKFKQMCKLWEHRGHRSPVGHEMGTTLRFRHRGPPSHLDDYQQGTGIHST